MKIYELRVEVLGEGVWRRLEVPAEMTLAGLHLTLQRAMGWTNSGLYAFETDDARYGVLNHEDEWMRDPRATDVRVRKVGELAARTRHIDYIYEGVRRWRHSILVEGAADARPDERYPRVVGGDGVTVMDALEPGSWREPSEDALPSFEQIQRQASADAGFDSLARLLEPLGSAPLLPEVITPPAPAPPSPRRLTAPPHIIRPPELMAACTSRLEGAYPEQGLEAFVAEVAERDLLGVHDMFTRKVVEDMLRRELGPPPAPPEPELAAEQSEEHTEEHTTSAAAADVTADVTEDVTEAVDGRESEREGEREDERVDAPADERVEEGEGAIEETPIENAMPSGDSRLEDVSGLDVSDFEGVSEFGAADSASLELGEVEGEALGALEDLEPSTGMEAAAVVEELSAWEEESWSLSEPEATTSLGEVGALSQERDALEELPAWGGGGAVEESLEQLGAMSASGFEPVAPAEADALIEAPSPEREAFEAAREEGVAAAFEVEPALKALPRSGELGGCLERVPAGWLDVIAEHLEVDVSRRDARAREIAQRLVRVEILAELVAAELSIEAMDLARELAAHEGPRGVRWCVEGSHVPDEDLGWFTFTHEGALGQLRRCGLAFVGVSGAAADLEVIVPVELRRPLQLILH